jgi:integrase
MRSLITAKLLGALCKEQRRVEVWDTRLPNFFVQLRASGHASYFVRFRLAGRLINLRLGDADVMGPAEARELARMRLREAASGQVYRAPQVTLTLAQAMEAHYIPHAKATKKSWFLDQSLLRQHILPVFGARPFSAITTAEVDAWHKSLRSDKGRSAVTCNHALFVLRRFYKLALETWQLPGLIENPAQKVVNFKVNNQRHVYLKPDEIQRLQEAAQKLRNPVVAPVIALLLLTGVRLQNALRARWEEFDEAAQVWHVPYTKSGKPQDVWLSEAALALLRGLASRQHSPWLFPHPRSGVPMHDMHYAWCQLQQQAQLPGVRLHDLRHTFASIMIQEGYSLYVVQNALGHHSPTMTMRYAHLANSTLKQAVNAVGRAVHYEPLQ